MNQVDTKNRIIRAAYELFCDHGVARTTVRDIAERANVNLAAINYHFSSKDGLASECLQFCFFDMDKRIKALAEQCSNENIESLMVKIFKLYTDDSFELHKSFKFFMFEVSSTPEQVTKHLVDFGPPGAAYIGASIKKSYPDITDENLRFAIKSLTAHIVHMALVFKSHVGITLNKNNQKDWDIDNIEGDIIKLVRLVFATT
jgi:AcrR family transcriptional regulator